MAKLKSGTRIYGTATIDTSVVVGSGVTINASGIIASAGIITATTFVGALTGTATSTTNIPNLTGAITSVNTTTSLGSFTSAQLATALTDETGSGANVFATSPTLVTPVLGAATATSIVVSSGSTFTNGPILVGTATSTGTASQPLQVTGGAYVSGSVGIGTTNPVSKLHVIGDGRFTGVVTATSFSGSGANLTGLVPNTVTISSASTPQFIGFVTTSSGVTSSILASSTLTFIPSSGNLGIGTTNPTSKLHVVGDGRFTGVVTATSFSGSGANLTGISAGLSVSDDTLTNATRYILFDDATSGTISAINVSSTQLIFNPSTGTLSATVFTSLSDANKKTNIRPIENAIEITKKLEGVRFDWIDSGAPSIGVIAQEVEKVLPELVVESDGTKSVSYGNIVGVLIEAIKEQQVRIEELERKSNA